MVTTAMSCALCSVARVAGRPGRVVGTRRPGRPVRLVPATLRAGSPGGAGPGGTPRREATVCGHAKSAGRAGRTTRVRALTRADRIGRRAGCRRRRALARDCRYGRARDDVSLPDGRSLRHRRRGCRTAAAGVEVARSANLLDAAGAVAPTVFATMSALAARTGAINLGQGFPDTDGPASLLEDAAAAIRGGVNQYPPGRGIPELRRAIAAHQAPLLRHRARPRHRGAGHGGGDGGASPPPLLALLRPRRRGRRPGAVLRRLRGRDRARRGGAPHGSAALPGVHPRARRPRRRRRAPHPA